MKIAASFCMLTSNLINSSCCLQQQIFLLICAGSHWQWISAAATWFCCMLVHMTTLLSACKEIEGSCGLLLLSSLAFAFVLPSFSLIPWLFSLRPSSRRLSRDELTSFPLPAPCRLSLALVLWAALRRLLEAPRPPSRRPSLRASGGAACRLLRRPASR